VRTPQRAREFPLQHSLDKAAHASHDTGFDRVEPIIDSKAPAVTDASFVVSFVMAWPSFQRTNAGIIGVKQPETTPTLFQPPPRLDPPSSKAPIHRHFRWP